MQHEYWLLSLTAVGIGTLHTLMGPDHYVPFVAMARAGRWSLRKTLLITALCGIGHVASSMLLGWIGIGLGLALQRLELVEGLRANIAGWMLLAFGLVYMARGLIRGLRNRPHEHLHAPGNETVHPHRHAHDADHLHVPEVAGSPERVDASLGAMGRVWGPWALFLIFAFGPCEPLIPLLMYPAAASHWLAVGLVSFLFTAATLLMMIGMVVGLTYGLRLLDLRFLDRFSHALSGMAITACGLAIKLGF